MLLSRLKHWVYPSTDKHYYSEDHINIIKPPTFTESTGILLQEEEIIKTFELDVRSSDLTLLAKDKQPYRGKPWDRNRESKFQPRNRGMTQSKFDTHDKKIDGCFYCGKPGHYAKYCYKRKANESK